MKISGNYPIPNNMTIMGWDIGGANLKAARLHDADLEVMQRPFAMWQRRDELVEALMDIALQLGPAQWVGVTMTAELSDAFRTKREGVQFVLEAMQAALPEVELRVFGVDGQFYDVATAYEQPLLVAAANWMATALIVARSVATCLLVDIGSTTTDIIPIVEGQVMARGRTDPQRLINGELLYTGALRTPVFAVVRRVPLWGSWCPVAAEHFATMQDVYLLLDHVAPEACTSPSADGRPITAEFAAERLARLVCADIELVSRPQLYGLAQYIAAEQVRQIAEAIAQVTSGNLAQGPLVAAGVGTFLVQAAAAQLGLNCLPLEVELGRAASDVAPAVALTLLLAGQEHV